MIAGNELYGLVLQIELGQVLGQCFDCPVELGQRGFFKTALLPFLFEVIKRLDTGPCFAWLRLCRLLKFQKPLLLVLKRIETLL